MSETRRHPLVRGLLRREICQQAGPVDAAPATATVRRDILWESNTASPVEARRVELEVRGELASLLSSLVPERLIRARHSAMLAVS
jgi:hypothetical protein